MSLLIAILTLVLIGLVVLVVTAPLRSARERRRSTGDSDSRSTDTNAGAAGGAVPGSDDHARDELEAAREAKYREIRDAELDFRTGKLSQEDYRAIDADLRAEAIEILNRLEELRPRDA